MVRRPRKVVLMYENTGPFAGGCGSKNNLNL